MTVNQVVLGSNPSGGADENEFNHGCESLIGVYYECCGLNNIELVFHHNYGYMSYPGRALLMTQKHKILSVRLIGTSHFEEGFNRTQVRVLDG